MKYPTPVHISEEVLEQYTLTIWAALAVSID